MSIFHAMFISLHPLSYNVAKIYLTSRIAVLSDDVCSIIFIIVILLSPGCHCVYMRLLLLGPVLALSQLLQGESCDLHDDILDEVLM